MFVHKGNAEPPLTTLVEGIKLEGVAKLNLEINRIYGRGNTAFFCLPWKVGAHELSLAQARAFRSGSVSAAWSNLAMAFFLPVKNWFRDNQLLLRSSFHYSPPQPVNVAGLRARNQGRPMSEWKRSTLRAGTASSHVASSAQRWTGYRYTFVGGGPYSKISRKQNLSLKFRTLNSKGQLQVYLGVRNTLKVGLWKIINTNDPLRVTYTRRLPLFWSPVSLNISLSTLKIQLTPKTDDKWSWTLNYLVFISEELFNKELRHECHLFFIRVELLDKELL